MTKKSVAVLRLAKLLNRLLGGAGITGALPVRNTDGWRAEKLREDGRFTMLIVKGSDGARVLVTMREMREEDA